MKVCDWLTHISCWPQVAIWTSVSGTSVLASFFSLEGEFQNVSIWKKSKKRHYSSTTHYTSDDVAFWWRCSVSFANMQCSVLLPAITLYYHISFDLPVFFLCVFFFKHCWNWYCTMFEQRASGPLCHFCFGGGIRRLLYWESGFTPIVHTRSQPFCSAPVVGFHLSFDIFRIKGDNLQ